MQQPKFPNQASKSKDPPCYEDAVKQRRTLQPSVQVTASLTLVLSQTLLQTLDSLQGPTPASQHMDDLFDVLIESGGKELAGRFRDAAVEVTAVIHPPPPPPPSHVCFPFIPRDLALRQAGRPV